MKNWAIIAASIILGGCIIASVILYQKNAPKPRKPVIIAFDGWHGNSFLKQGCTVLQNEHDRVSKMSALDQGVLFAYTNKHYLPCLWSSDVLNRQTEAQIMSAVASNPACHGVTLVQGYYGPNDSAPELVQLYSSAQWRLALDLTPSAETGDISLPDSRWTLHPRTLSGTLTNLQDATTQICTIVKGEGGT